MRFIVLLLSLSTLVFYGYAVGGLWGYLVGRPHLVYIVWGLSGGTATGAMAVYLWHRFLVSEIYKTAPGEDEKPGD